MPIIAVYKSDSLHYTVDLEPGSWEYDRHEVSAATEMGNEDLQILGAIQGGHTLTCPCEDACKAAWSVDLEDPQLEVG